jgi:hypothetical protein
MKKPIVFDMDDRIESARLRVTMKLQSGDPSKGTAAGIIRATAIASDSDRIPVGSYRNRGAISRTSFRMPGQDCANLSL